MVILTDLTYNTLLTAAIDQIPYNDIKSSLYLSEADYKTKYPTQVRILSYADSRTYFLFAHKHGEFSHKIVNYATEKKKVSITDIKQNLIDAEQYLRAHPTPLSGKASAHQASAFQATSMSSDYSSQEIDKLVAQAITGVYHTDFVHSSDESATTLATTDDDYSAFFASSNSFRVKDPEYLKPCGICKHARDTSFRTKAQEHIALLCPALAKLATLSDLQINTLGFPTSIQAVLPKYSDLLSKRNSSKATEPNSGSAKRPFDHGVSSEVEQLKKKIAELQREAVVGPPNPYARQAFVPSSNEAKELNETKA